MNPIVIVALGVAVLAVWNSRQTAPAIFHQPPVTTGPVIWPLPVDGGVYIPPILLPWEPTILEPPPSGSGATWPYPSDPPAPAVPNAPPWYGVTVSAPAPTRADPFFAPPLGTSLIEWWMV